MKAATEALGLLLCLALAGLIDLRYADESAFSLQPNVPYGQCAAAMDAHRSAARHQ